MILVKGNFLTQKADVYVATTNGVITSDDGTTPRLVMGRGAAQALTRMFRGAERILARRILKTGTKIALSHHTGAVYSYGGAVEYYGNGKYIGAFQTKLDWRERSKTEVISESVDWWCEHAVDLDGAIRGAGHEGRVLQISMNFPGIGLGGLRREVVEPLLRRLPDNITVCVL